MQYIDPTTNRSRGYLLLRPGEGIRSQQQILCQCDDDDGGVGIGVVCDEINTIVNNMKSNHDDCDVCDIKPTTITATATTTATTDITVSTTTPVDVKNMEYRMKALDEHECDDCKQNCCNTKS